MHHDTENQFRELLEDDPPRFIDRVDSPWDTVPDFAEYNKGAYRHIVRDLKAIRKENDLVRSGAARITSNSRGVLILGEAGTGKTHLLMRVAQNLSESNHILFVRKPNNEEAVAQHVWANIVNSLTRYLPTGDTTRSQLDDLLAHVFSHVLIPEFERDVEEGTDTEQRQRWLTLLRENPFNLFLMLGEGERRQTNMGTIRRRTLRYLQTHHPDVDQRIASALITYCFVAREENKRLLLTWLSGQDLDDGEAQRLGLPPAWVAIDDTSTNISTQQQREEQALRAIRTIGILSTHYQPLILAFDQLEGLRNEHRLTQRWGDVIREIFTMTPNLLIVTCIFPSLWKSWFREELDESAAQRISQKVIELEKFQINHGVVLLTMHLAEQFARHQLPTNIYPFTEEDITDLCAGATSPRVFLQRTRRAFDSWLDEEYDLSASVEQQTVVTQESIASTIVCALDGFQQEQRESYGNEIPIEEDCFGRIRNLFQVILRETEQEFTLDKATRSHYVMPPNFIIRPAQGDGHVVCVAVMNSVGNAFAHRIKNLNMTHEAADQYDRLIIVRDRRCKRVGAKSQAYLQDIQDRGAVFIHAGIDEITTINALYDTLTAVEEHDISVGSHEVDKPQFVHFLKNTGILLKTQLFRHVPDVYGGVPSPTGHGPLRTRSLIDLQKPAATQSAHSEAAASPRTPPEAPQAAVAPRPARSAGQASADLPIQVLIGDTNLNSPHAAVLGELKRDGRCLGISLTKPQCMVLLGYMGSGKSYALGVLIENALLASKGVISQSRPMAVVAFNFRKNPEARFEYDGFKRPNQDVQQVERLRSQYSAEPQAVNEVTVFGYEPELARRSHEYRGLPTRPILFRSNELGAEHWEILMKPPSAQAEYMDVIRDIIQKLYYQERLTFRTLESQIMDDDRLSTTQRRRAMNRLTFAEKWIDDDRSYEWADCLQEGQLNIFDLRMQTMDSSEALKLCLVISDLVRRTRNGVNKIIVFDEAHEYVDCRELVGELENAITQIRHDGLSFVLTSQFPERIPEQIFRYLATRFVFKLPTGKAVSYLHKAATNLAKLSAQEVGNLDLEQGVCFVQTDDDCTDSGLRSPQQLQIRPRLTHHGGATVRHTTRQRHVSQLMHGDEEVGSSARPSESGNAGSGGVLSGATLGEMAARMRVAFDMCLELLGLPRDVGLTEDMTYDDAVRKARRPARGYTRSVGSEGG